MIQYEGGAQLLRMITGKSAPWGRVYIGLSTTAPAYDGTNFTEPVEASGGEVVFAKGYSRVLIGQNTGGAANVMTDPVENATENNQIIFFNEAEATWGTVTHWGLFLDNEPGSKPVISGALTSSLQIPANYVPLFRVGAFQLSVT